MSRPTLATRCAFTRAAWLYGLLDFAGPQTPGADANALDGALFHNPNAMEVWIELPRTYVMSVRDSIAKNRALCANVALHRHMITPLKAANNINHGVSSQYRLTVGVRK